MNQSDLGRALSKELGISRVAAEETIRALVRVMGRTLAGGDSVLISNFGTLKPVLRRTPSTSIECTTQSNRLKVNFRVAPRLLEAIQAGDDQADFQKRPKELPSVS